MVLIVIIVGIFFGSLIYRQGFKDGTLKASGNSNESSEITSDLRARIADIAQAKVLSISSSTPLTANINVQGSVFFEMQNSSLSNININITGVADPYIGSYFINSHDNSISSSTLDFQCGDTLKSAMGIYVDQ